MHKRFISGEVKRGMGFWSPIGDSPLGSLLPKAYESVTRSSLAMPVPLLALPQGEPFDHPPNLQMKSKDSHQT